MLVWARLNAGSTQDSFKVRSQCTLFSHQIFLLLTSHCSPWSQRHSHNVLTGFTQWLRWSQALLSRGSSEHMMETRQKMKAWHITPESFSLLCNAPCSSMEGFDFKQPLSSQRMTRRNTMHHSGDFSSRQSRPDPPNKSLKQVAFNNWHLCLNTKVPNICCHTKQLYQLWVRIITE